MTQQLSDAKRVVVKIGSSLLVDDATGAIHREWLAGFIEDLAASISQGQEIILVSSGAIALGRRHLQIKDRHLQLEEKQAAAAIGQIQLAHAYQTLLAEAGIKVAQILLTLDDSENRRRYLNAKNTLETLLRLKIMPIINENDTVATAEIRFGDNDRLAARVAQMMSADTLVLLSDIDGLYTANPNLDQHASLIPEVRTITNAILAMAGGTNTNYGTGGMVTKLAAAKIAQSSGCRMVIVSGKHLHPLRRIDKEKKGTWFIPDITPQKARKNWIAQHLKTKGQIIIDAGAVSALKAGKSLLPIGVIDVKGHFHKGDAVAILTENQQEIARGLINYPAVDAKKMIRHKSSELIAVLGYRGSDELIHRDDLVFLREMSE